MEKNSIKNFFSFKMLLFVDINLKNKTRFIITTLKQYILFLIYLLKNGGLIMVLCLKPWYYKIII